MQTRFVNDMQARIKALEARLAELAGAMEARELDARDRQHFQIRMKEVEERKGTLEARLKAAREASGSAWEAIREEAEVIYGDLVSYMDEVYSQYDVETGLY